MKTESLGFVGPAVPVDLRLMEEGDDHRQPLEHFIHATYAYNFGADIRQFMPTLMGLRDESQRYVAALGFRPAQDQRLFLEQYLDQPVESAIAAHLHLAPGSIARERVMEIGNLAGSNAGATRWLIIALAAYLQGAGYDWAVFTAVPSLRNSFHRLGLRPMGLGVADPAHLPACEQQAWGRYYDNQPMVSVVNVPHTYGMLDRYLRLERAVALLHKVWEFSYQAGSRALLAARAEVAHHA